MSHSENLIFKTATESWEFDAIHKLNYRTFVEEIPQHSANSDHILVDKFHDLNTYIICIHDSKLKGMIAINDKRPFSLDYKLDNLDSYLPDYRSVFEIRLLAVENPYRNTAIFTGLLKKVYQVAFSRQYDLGIISGTDRQLKLYQHLGFTPFGPLVGKQGALYQPMFITLDHALAFRQNSTIFSKNPPASSDKLNFLPGPVCLSKGVDKAISAAPASHRGHQFINDFKTLEKLLCQRVNSDRVFITTGSGSLANDIVAAQLSLLNGKGLVLVNGEFGRRLENHASRAGLDYDICTAADGETFNTEDIRKTIETGPDYSWLWLVHCETSTGVLNDVNSLRKLCKHHNIKLCLDSISAIGACHVELEDVYLASATSGKGIASLPGLALIFAGKHLSHCNRKLPGYFDLSYYEQKGGIPFTISSNAVYALLAALQNSDWEQRFANVKQWSENLRKEITACGLKILAQESCRAPHVTTITLPENISSIVLGDAMDDEGFHISYRSEYLLRNNQIQICLMGECYQPPRELIFSLDRAIQRQRLHHDSDKQTARLACV